MNRFPHRLYIAIDVPNRKPLTICIASICENKYVIVLSDRMITVSVPSIEYEPRSSKLIRIADNCVAATAGDALAPTDITREVRLALQQRPAQSIHAIIDQIKNCYAELRSKRIMEEVLRPVGHDFSTYYQQQQAFQPQVALGLFESISKYDYQVWMLIGGVDQAGPHIHRIENPGTSASFDSIGFNAIGSGEDHAVTSFITNDYESDIDLNEGLLLTYESKKLAEKASGVGTKTNMQIVGARSIIELSDDDIRALNSLYEKKRELLKSSRESLAVEVKNLDFHKKMEAKARTAT